MSTDDFVTRLGAQLYEAALREERRGSLRARSRCCSSPRSTRSAG